ncbi:Ig-like domain-containing alpha-2-macroglobulin family protein [Polyangium aurulentum]|uniref:Ig-like domain-containing alpha-2-macroglobulin family protein n=1 Tax=Polyangium aurulentum TaxID=2567896 RepID=UPI0010ADAD7D|nr:Ig-like domain-containing alpha-2-macroglobulin family protein [Polyangium aurulentum]UQA58276.1 Ig-like domain-containing protein [Polyangium aurulentum]
MASPRRRVPLAALTLATLAGACISAPRPPAAPLRGGFALGAKAPVTPSVAGPLRVVFGAPESEIAQGGEITLVFNKPMRPLGLGPHEPPPPVRMSPEAPGRWQWIGSSALRFTPAKPLPRATSFRVEVEAGARSLDGSALEETFVLSFHTPRPALSGSEPGAGAEGVLPDASITLFFNAPITAEEVKRAVTLRAPSPVPFTIAEIEGERVRITPRSPLPRASAVKVLVDASLRGTEGALTAGKGAEISFRTVGPLAVSSFDCAPHPSERGACDVVQSAITLRFTNPVPDEVVREALAFEPPPDSFDVHGTGEDGTSAEFNITGWFEPGKTYRARLRARRALQVLRDVHGQPLRADAVEKFRFGDLPPHVQLGADGTYWSSSAPRILPVGVTNAQDASISLLPLGKDQALTRLAGLAPAIAMPAGARPFAPPPGKTNEERWSQVRLDDLLPDAPPRGPVLVRARHGAHTDDRELQLTDIGLLSKIGRDAASVWVTGLSAGTPTPGARVEVHYVPKGGRPSLLGAADAGADGLATVPLKAFSHPREGDGRIAVVARRGEDWAYQATQEPGAPPAMGLVFSDRGLYRPGERVELKGIVRIGTARGLVTPAGREVLVRVTNSEGREVSLFRAPLTRHGTFHGTVSLRKDASLGFYRVAAALDGDTVTGRFAVDEYEPTQTKAEARIDGDAYIAGDRMRCTARGEYLYGAPMAGGRASVVVTREPGYHSIAGLDKYVLTEHDANTTTATVAKGSGTLDASGEFSMPVSLALPGQTTTETVTCHVEVADLNRDVRASQASATVHPTDVYVALDRESMPYSVNPGESLEPRLLVVTPSGARRAFPVHVELTRRIHRDDGAIEDLPLGACDVTSGAKPVSCKLAVPQLDPGPQEEVIVRASTKDSLGRRAAASYDIDLEPKPAPAPKTTAPPAPEPPEPPERHRLRGPASSLRVGEKLRIPLHSPFDKPGQALITVEREGILWKRLVPLPPRGTAPQTVEIPITDAMMPNAMVDVNMIAGSKSERDGFHFSVDARPRRLDVTVRPAKEYAAPGEAIDVEVVVKDAAGKPARAEVTLWAADEGTLYVARYVVPAPWEHLFAERFPLVETADARDDLVHTWSGSRHRARPPQVRMGATSIAPPRGDFRQTVVFLPDLATDENGRVRRRVTLPDGLTAYRFMAVAVAEDDRAGADDASVLTSKPVMARPSLPRVLRAGDQFEASVVVSSQDLPASTVTVEARASTPSLVAMGSLRKTQALSPDRPVEVRFPFRAERTGPAKLLFEAALHGRRESDAVVLAPEVVAPFPLETARIHGETASAVAEGLGPLKGLRADSGGLTLSLSSTPLSGLAQGIEQLIAYPYGCTEQTVSRMVPLLALRDLADSLGVRLPKSPPGPRPGGELAVALRNAVDSIVANQRRDGGFGLWPGSDESDPWITAYALWGLGEARRRGMPVREEITRRAEQYLARTPEQDPSDLDLAQAAFTAYVLAEDGRPDESRTAALFSARARLPLFARALLLHAMAKSGRAKPDEIAELSRDLAAAIRIDGAIARVVEARRDDGLLFDSDVRTAAMVLRALLAVDPAHPLAARLALGLLEARRDGAYRTTHEAAWALLALDAYRRNQPPPAADLKARVFLGDKLLADTTFASSAPARKAIAEIPMSDLIAGAGAPLTFAASGRGKLFYEAELRFARKEPSTEPVEAGFYVQKSIRPVAQIGATNAASAGPLDTTIKAGEVVLCELEIVTPAPRRFVMIEDPLPGGLEAVRFDLRTGDASMAGLEEGRAERREVRDDRVAYFVDSLPAGVTRYRYLARATHIGTFIAPPTRVEEMYAPEIHGRTAGGRVKVTSN